MAPLQIQVKPTKWGVFLLDGDTYVEIDWLEMEEVIREMTAAFNEHISRKG